MSRGMWIIGAIIAVMVIAMMWQESSGGIERPWAECKESLVQQMFSSTCTPRSGLSGPGAVAPGGEAPAPDPADRPVGEIRRN
ncbi:MAG TPA: hypothetical protein VIR38_02175 [Thalassobaculum sp.]